MNSKEDTALRAADVPSEDKSYFCYQCAKPITGDLLVERLAHRKRTGARRLYCSDDCRAASMKGVYIKYLRQSKVIPPTVRDDDDLL